MPKKSKKQTPTFFKKNKKIIQTTITILVISIILTGTWAAVKLAGQRQDLRKEATSPECSLLADINGDNIVDQADYDAIVAKMMQSCVGCPEDIWGPEGQKDGKVDIWDYVKLSETWMETCAVTPTSEPTTTETPTNTPTTEPTATEAPTATPTEEPTPTLTPDQQACSNAGGEWITFSNGCVDSCYYAANPAAICTAAMTPGCECGADSCWDGNTCVPNPTPELTATKTEPTSTPLPPPNDPNYTPIPTETPLPAP